MHLHKLFTFRTENSCEIEKDLKTLKLLFRKPYLKLRNNFHSTSCSPKMAKRLPILSVFILTILFAAISALVSRAS